MEVRMGMTMISRLGLMKFCSRGVIIITGLLLWIFRETRNLLMRRWWRLMFRLLPKFSGVLKRQRKKYMHVARQLIQVFRLRCQRKYQKSSKVYLVWYLYCQIPILTRLTKNMEEINMKME